MRRLALAALVAGAFLAPTAASACELETCVFTSPVCTKVNCHICYYEPPGAMKCIT